MLIPLMYALNSMAQLIVTLLLSLSILTHGSISGSNNIVGLIQMTIQFAEPGFGLVMKNSGFSICRQRLSSTLMVIWELLMVMRLKLHLVTSATSILKPGMVAMPHHRTTLAELILPLLI